MKEYTVKFSYTFVVKGKNKAQAEKLATELFDDLDPMYDNLHIEITEVKSRGQERSR